MPNMDYLRALEATIFEELQLELDNEVRAHREQAADDAAMAEALSVHPHGHDSAPDVPQLPGHVSEEVNAEQNLAPSSGAKPKKRGPGGVTFPSPEVIPRAFHAVETHNGTSVTVRFVIRRYTHSVGTPTD